MIRKFLAKVFRGTRAKRNVSTTKKRGRRIAIEPLESRRLLAVTGGLSGFAYLDVHDFGTKDADEAGFAGLTVRLKSVGSQGNLSDVSGVGPFQTLAGGAYSFNGLAAGTYQIQISPSSKLAVGVLSVGSAGGTAGSNEIQVTLAADQVATDYNFAILGAQTNQISLRMFMASTGSLTDFLTTLHTAPSSTTGGSSISSFSATYTTGGPAMAVVSSNATLTAADSPTLTAMTVTLQNPQDGSSEQLSADTTGTLLTSNYANNVLTVSGVANVADYQTVLRTVKYGITAWPAQAGDRTLSIVINDGTATSTAAISTINVVQGTEAAPTVTTNPIASTVNAGNMATFTAAASANPASTVQWMVNTGSGFVSLSNDAVYSGVTTTTLTITGATAGLSGNQYEAVFTNSFGTATTTPATLTVDHVTTAPTSQTINVSQNAIFTTASSNPSGSDTVQWKVNTGSGFVSLSNDAIYSGVTATTLVVTGATAGLNNNQYEAVFTNSTGTLTSSLATLTVDHVTTAPASQTINAGLNTSFTAISSNPSGSDTVQWKVNTGSGFVSLSNDAIYGGVTTTTLAITGATAGLNGNQYEAVFTNSLGTIASSAAMLTVNYAPIVTASPVASAVNAGNMATFTAAATSGNPASTVQWKVNTGSGFVSLSNDTVYSGVTTTTLAIAGATAGLSGNQYEAVFTNSIGFATTTPATLTVDHVTTAPTSQTINASLNTTFTAISSNPSGSDTVQWKVNTGSGFVFLSNDTTYGGVTTTILTITGATAGMNGNQYEAVFTNSAGMIASSPATLTVNYAPIVTVSPVASTVNAGNTATFTAAANGSPTPTVQWMMNAGSGFVPLSNDTIYSGATTTTLVITGATAGMNGNQYEAIFTNSIGSATTAPAALTVDYVATAPTPQTIDVGQNTTFTAISSNPSGSDTVQWKVNTGSGFVFLSSNDLVYSGVTTTTLTITGATTGLNGNQYEAVFTNGAGTLTSSPATLTVNYAPIVATSPVSSMVNVENTATFTATANGSPTPTVQWMVNTGSGFVSLSNDIVYSGVTTTTLTITGATADLSGNQYEAVFTNIFGTATTTPATLTVDHVTTAPTSQTINAGLNTSFTAISSNPSGSDTVQWKVNAGSGFVPLSNDAIYSGVTTTTLAITGATAGMNGNQYEAVFTNGTGTLTSSLATLTVDHVTTAPTSQTINAGLNTSFTAISSNPSGSDTVQWQVNTGSGFISLSNDTTYGGVTTTILTVTGATAGLNGNQYEAVFTNSLGMIASSAATLTVNHAPIVTASPVASTVNAGNTATFTAVATSGNPASTVQWKVNAGSGFVSLSNDTVYSGVTTTTLTIAGATAGLSGNQYEAVFTNSAGFATTAPAALTVLSVTGISPSSGPTGGSTIVTINGSGFTPASIVKFGTAVATSVVYVSPTQITATAPVGTVGAVDITVTTVGGTTATSASDQFSYTAYPSGYAFTVDQSLYNPTTGKSAGFTITNAEVGATLTYLIVGNVSGYVINHVPVTSATQDVTGIDITSLSAGQITFLVTLTNAAGIEGPQLVDYATLDKTVVTPDQNTINAVAVNSTGFTLSGVEVGATYNYTISNVSASPMITGGSPIVISGASVVGSGKVTSANQDITGINLSTLADGAITFSVTVTDLAGHTGSPVVAQATIDRTVPTAIALSASVAPAGQPINTLVSALQTVGPQSLASYTYSLVSVDGSTDTASFPFHISGDELLTSAVLSSVGHPSYSIRVRSTDLQGKFIEQQFLITVGSTNPVTPILGLDKTFIPVGPSNTTVGALSTTAASGGLVASQTSYSLVAGTGSTNNSLFQVVNANGTELLKTASALSAGTYSVRVRSSGTFLISDVVNIDGISGPYTYQVSLDPTKLPSSNYSFLSANAGLISLASAPTAGSWYPAVSQNEGVGGSLAQPNYLGSYSSFWASITAANPTATLADVVGSSGVDLASNTAWAVVDRSGEYAVGVQVFTERTFTITVTP